MSCLTRITTDPKNPHTECRLVPLQPTVHQILRGHRAPLEQGVTDDTDTLAATYTSMVKAGPELQLFAHLRPEYRQIVREALWDYVGKMGDQSEPARVILRADGVREYL